MWQTFEPACRICLAENISPPYMYLLEEETSTEAIENVLNLQTKLFDVSIYPNHLCGSCRDTIDTFTKLQQLSIQHERFILRYQAKIKSCGLKIVKELHLKDIEQSVKSAEKDEAAMLSDGETLEEICEDISDPLDLLTDEKEDQKTEEETKVQNKKSPSKILIDKTKKRRKVWKEKHKAGHCDECKKYFKDMAAHRKNFHHIGLQLVQCSTCPKTFMGKQQLREHMKRHESEKVSCPQCGPDRIMEKRSLPGHIKTFHKAKDIPCDIPECNVFFKKKADMKNHVAVVHLNKKQLCVQCGDEFKDLKYHVQTFHENIHFPCEICHKKYTTKQALNYHVKNQHGTRKKEVCDYCAVEVFNVKHHIKMKHSGPVEKSVPCQVETCDRLFRTKQEATIHYNAAHLNKKEMCPLCGGWFKNLYTHIHQIHQSEKKHVCEQCGKAFGKKNDLQVHKDRVHLGKRYVCPECGKSISKLREHMKTVHNNTNFSMADVEDIKYEPVMTTNKYEPVIAVSKSEPVTSMMTILTEKHVEPVLDVISADKFQPVVIAGSKGEPVLTATVISGQKFEPLLAGTNIVATTDKTQQLMTATLVATAVVPPQQERVQPWNNS